MKTKLIANVRNNVAHTGLTVWIAAVIVTLLLFGCAANANYISPKKSNEMTLAFETYQLSDEYQYFHLGWDNHPYAIIGLKPGYTIVSRYWTPMDPEKTSLKKLVDAIYVGPKWRPRGATVVDQQGNPIGVWYSSAAAVGIKVNPENQQVSIFTDQPWARDDRYGSVRAEKYDGMVVMDRSGAGTGHRDAGLSRP